MDTVETVMDGLFVTAAFFAYGALFVYAWHAAAVMFRRDPAATSRPFIPESFEVSAHRVRCDGSGRLHADDYEGLS